MLLEIVRPYIFIPLCQIYSVWGLYMSQPEIVNLDEMFSRKSIIAEPPEDSVLRHIVPIQSEPAIVLYGPTKGGKTRLAAWEATALATKLNRRVLFLLSESNIEQEDIRDILAACVYHNVYCHIERFDHLRGLVAFTQKFDRDFQRAVRKESSSELELMPKVVVIDSITSMANLVVEGLSENIVESGAPTMLPYIYPRITKVINPIRRLLSAEYLNGYLIMVAHETQLRGEVYVPGTGVRSKPKYAGSAQYNDDTEIYLGTPRELPDSLKTCEEVRNNAPHYRPLITAISRRHPEYIGIAVAIRFVRFGEGEITIKRGKKKEKVSGEQQQFVGYGVVEKSSGPGGTTYKFTPKDMLGDESQAKQILAKPLIPVVGCGPKAVS